jgi:hypothetical protein
MSKNKPPLAPEVHQPDHFWEYLNSIAGYTIDMRNELNNACLLAVNNNIIRFQQNPEALSKHIEEALAVVKAVDAAIPGIRAQHADKTGYAMDTDNLSEYLRINELYVQQQALLMDALQRHGAAILAMSDAAHQHAIAAEAKNKVSDPVVIAPNETPQK